MRYVRSLSPNSFIVGGEGWGEGEARHTASTPWYCLGATPSPNPLPRTSSEERACAMFAPSPPTVPSLGERVGVRGGASHWSTPWYCFSATPSPNPLPRTSSGERAFAMFAPSPPTAPSLGERVGVRGRRVALRRRPGTSLALPPHPTLSPEQVRERGLSYFAMIDASASPRPRPVISSKYESGESKCQ